MPEAVFAIEEHNFPFAAPSSGKILNRDKRAGVRPFKPLYLLSVSAKRYGLANIVKRNGREFAGVEDIYRDPENALVIVRKATGHGMGHIEAPPTAAN